MHVLITGGAGFLGVRLAKRLLRRGTLAGSGNAQQTIDQITLLDVIPATGIDDPRVRIVTGDIAEPRTMADAFGLQTQSVFHLAAVVSSQAEADFDLGMKVNLDATRLLLERARALGQCPRIVFTSSVAVFGGMLPDCVEDATAATPQSSYGTQKAIGELLIADYSRRGFIDGRALRMPTVSVRPGVPNKAASSFASGIIREPLNGHEAVCPVAPETVMWLVSPRMAVDNLIRGHDLGGAALAASRVLNLPGLSVSVGEMIAALQRAAGDDAVKRIHWQLDEAVTRIVNSWPGNFATTRADALGFRHDLNYDEIIRAYVEDDFQHPS